ncbi:MAG: DUF4232 domain-containing protein [Actinomycetota bacterium]|jgi:hypothetical protein|nr:DUF4232 domain-containing protein [Actinomycetota bacterium]
MRRCSGTNLRVGFFAGAGAAGTALTGIGIANTSATPCWLGGGPAVSLFSPSGRAISQTTTYGSHYFPAAARVVLRHMEPVLSQLMRYPAISAGFVIASRDFANGTNSSTCSVVGSMTVQLPGVHQRYVVRPDRVAGGAPALLQLCDIPPPVAISAVLSREVLLTYVGR